MFSFIFFVNKKDKTKECNFQSLVGQTACTLPKILYLRIIVFVILLVVL